MKPATTTPWMGRGFWNSTQKYPDHPAVEIDGVSLSYLELFSRAKKIAHLLTLEVPSPSQPLTAVFAARSASAFAGILGTLFRGHGYVPLNPKFPAERTQHMLKASGCASIIVDRNAQPRLKETLSGMDGLVLIFPEHDDTDDLQAEYPTHRVFTSTDLAEPEHWVQPETRADDIAYLLFTSGSTGNPKGVMISHANIDHFLNAMMDRYQFNQHDRFSHMFDLVFDLSVFDLFMAWEAGGCVCCPQDSDLLLPADYIQTSRLSVWFSVPSVAVLSLRLRQLEPGRFDKLKWNLFCGEALPSDAASAWATAASNGVLENLYGPTELTLACALYRWNGSASLEESHNGIVPIGSPYPGMQALISADDGFTPANAGEEGELLMAGPQVALGYWNDPEKTKAAFQPHPETGVIYYRTGDLVRWSAHDKHMEYVGRVDNQIKIHGMRVELGEIEATIKALTNALRVVAVGWPADANGISGVTCFVEGDVKDSAQILQSAKSRLPAYMVPKKLISVADFPLNSNGKIDRKALLASLRRKD
jgi:amino acid adenylation domain-containing protein